MQFGELVRLRRQERRWNIRKLEAKSLVNRGAISRIESGKSQALVETTIRLSKTLNIRPIEFIQKIETENIFLHSTYPPKSSKYLSYLDLQELINCINIRPITIIDRIIEISKKYLSLDGQNSLQFSEYYEMRSNNGNEDIKQTIMGINKEIEYPNNLTIKTIIMVNNHGGAITLKDIGFYIRSTRRNRSMSLTDLQDICKIPDSTLCNIENAVYKKIKLDDVIILDKALKAKGELIGLFWNTFEFHPPIPEGGVSREWANLEIALSKFIVGIYRWLQSQDEASAAQWLNTIRL